LTQLKYAVIMFGPSLKSVPGCLVSIVPMLIGEPVALTPGFGPQDEVLVLADVVVEPVLGELDVPLVAGAAWLVVWLLEPHPANASAATMAANAAHSCTRGPCWDFLTCLSSFVDEGMTRPGVRRG
jgi:hypothetical protein